MYLGAQLSQVNIDGVDCWTISDDKYVTAAVKNVETVLAEEGQRLPTKCYTPPMLTDYHPELDRSGELGADGLNLYQELVGVLCSAVELGRVDILLETALLSNRLALPRIGHLHAVYRVFG
jgi:hypothetical protein